MYKEQIKSAIPHEQKAIFSKRKQELEPPQYESKGQTQNFPPQTITKSMQPQNPGQQIVNLQVYQPAPEKKPMPKPNITADMFTPFNTTSMMFPPQFMANQGVTPQPVLPFNVIKNYNINTNGPMDNHTSVAMIYEDMLPDEKFLKNSTSISERMLLYDFIRSALFNKGDGRDINLDGKKGESLISKLKFVELNPYNVYRFSKNPYKGLPDNMLIYRSCYPIRYDTRQRCVTCAPDSIAVNVRIYNMTEEEFDINTIPEGKTIDNFDTWRELTYYAYVKENIIKTNECPNFVTMFGHYLARDTRIDFNKILQIKGKPIIDEPKYLSNIPFVQEQENNPNNLRNMRISSRLPPFIPPSHGEYGTMRGGDGSGIATVETNPKASTGKAMVVLTEAPNYNIYGWASRLEQRDGNIHRVINTGFHTDGVWMSVLFQIMVAFYAMSKKKICIRDFDFEHNVFIKDIDMDNTTSSYWKYIVDGIEYFVPNHGYMAMIDTSFRDVPISSDPETSKKHKIYCPAIEGGEDVMSDDEIQTEIFRCFKKSFSNDYFNDKNFKDNGGSSLPEKIMTMFTKIRSDDKTDIKDYISEYMKGYINNRVGTLLKENEIKFIVDDFVEYKKGQIYVYPVNSESYKFVMFLSHDDADEGACFVYTKNGKNNDIVTEKVNSTSLRAYNSSEPIVQDVKSTSLNLSNENITETFII